MATHPIGTGTRNLTLNVPTDEQAELGRLAFRSGARSVGDFVRHLVLLGLEAINPDAAQQVKYIRHKYYGV